MWLSRHLQAMYNGIFSLIFILVITAVRLRFQLRPHRMLTLPSLQLPSLCTWPTYLEKTPHQLQISWPRTIDPPTRTFR